MAADGACIGAVSMVDLLLKALLGTSFGSRLTIALKSLVTGLTQMPLHNGDG